MTAASKGLHRALARAGSGAIAIAEMQTADLLAEMTDEQKTALAAAIAPTGAVSSAPAGAPEGNVENTDPEPVESEPKPKGEGAASTGDARLKAVAKAVATDDNCKGKGALALSILADDDYKGLSASGVIKMLGSAAHDTTSPAAEEAARAEMRAAIAEGKNSNIDANGGTGGKDKAADSAGVWDRAMAREYPGLRK